MIMLEDAFHLLYMHVQLYIQNEYNCNTNVDNIILSTMNMVKI